MKILILKRNKKKAEEEFLSQKDEILARITKDEYHSDLERETDQFALAWAIDYGLLNLFPKKTSKLEKEFKEYQKTHQSEINEQVNIAVVALKKAKELSIKYKIPFNSPVVPSSVDNLSHGYDNWEDCSMTYVPVTAFIKFGPELIKKEFGNHYKYGWDSSSLQCE